MQTSKKFTMWMYHSRLQSHSSLTRAEAIKAFMDRQKVAQLFYIFPELRTSPYPWIKPQSSADDEPWHDNRRAPTGISKTIAHGGHVAAWDGLRNLFLSDDNPPSHLPSDLIHTSNTVSVQSWHAQPRAALRYKLPSMWNHCDKPWKLLSLKLPISRKFISKIHHFRQHCFPARSQYPSARWWGRGDRKPTAE